MAVPEHLKIVMRGTVLDTPEIWSMSLKYESVVSGGPDLDANAFNTDGVNTANENFFSTGVFDTRLQLEEWRAYKIGTDGNMEGDPKIVVLETGDFVHGAASIKYPPQVAICITTVGENRGPARYGRFFLPCVGYAMDSTSRLSSANAGVLAGVCSTWVKDISGAIERDLSFVNSPLVNISSRGGGVSQDVDHIRCGRALDTQRRRRNALAEEYVDTGTIDW